MEQCKEESQIQDHKKKLPNQFHKMPIKNLEKKEEILWNAKSCGRKAEGQWNAAKDSKKNKTDNHMKEV